MGHDLAATRAQLRRSASGSWAAAAVGFGASGRRAGVKRFDTAKLAMSVFIASEAVFFAFLIAAYVYFYGAVVHGGPGPKESLDPPRTLIFTLCLLSSSGTLWLAERRLTSSDNKAFRLWLGATILLGAVFIAGQGVEYKGLIARSITPERNLFGATFFTLTGFHGLHVLCGLISLAVLLVLAFMNDFGQRQRSGLGAVSLYWHFVDAVWIVIFSLVYLTVWI
jgi:heme/copper-type cytochrome/quinol oxidase subunit 3